MADNIGGGTIHSFGGIPFKDRRGQVVNASGFMDDDKQSLQSKKWHNLRVVLCDEIEAAGVDIIGKTEAKMRSHVPVANSVTDGLQSIQHKQRHIRRAFAGVNVMFFGDFWQLDPTG